VLPVPYRRSLPLNDRPWREDHEEVPEVEVGLPCVSPDTPPVILGMGREGSLLLREALNPKPESSEVEEESIRENIDGRSCHEVVPPVSPKVICGGHGSYTEKRRCSQ
jgi:hypothetical protein